MENNKLPSKEDDIQEFEKEYNEIINKKVECKKSILRFLLLHFQISKNC